MATHREVSNAMLVADVIPCIVRMVAEGGGDASTLKACVFVSRVWRYSARPYIFRRIVIRDERALDTFHTLLGDDRAVQGYVRELEFEGRLLQGARMPSQETSWILGAPLRLAHRLGNVRTICFRKCLGPGNVCRPNEELLEGLSRFTSATRLVVQYCGCREDFAFRCAGILPNLRHLEVEYPLHYAILGGEPSEASILLSQTYPIAEESLQLSTLRLSAADQWQDAILWRLLESPTHFRLRTLRVDLFHSFEDVFGAIAKIGSSLEELELDVRINLEYTSIAQGSPPRDNPLRSCTALRRLTLRVTYAIALRSAVILLEYAPLAHLEHIGFGLIGCMHARDGSWSPPNFAELSAALQAPGNFTGIRTFNFSYQGPDTPPGIWQSLQETLPPEIMRKTTYTHVLTPY